MKTSMGLENVVRGMEEGKGVDMKTIMGSENVVRVEDNGTGKGGAW